MWARAELQSSHGIWVVFLWWKQVWGFIFGVGFLDKDNSWTLRRSDWSFHRLVVPAKRNHICCDSFVQMLHVFTYSPEHYTAWTACFLSRVSRHTSVVSPRGFVPLTEQLVHFKEIDWIESLSDAGLNVNFIFPHHQTATEEATAQCQPPSPTTRPMTATPGAPTTAPTEAAVAPLVRRAGPEGKEWFWERHSEVIKSTYPEAHALLRLFVVSSSFRGTLFNLTGKVFFQLINVVNHIITYTPQASF